MSLLLNSVRGLITGTIPIFDIDVKFTTTEVNSWSGNISPTNKIDFYEHPLTKYTYGASAGNTYVIYDTGDTTNERYQAYMSDLNSKCGALLSTSVDSDRVKKIIWEIVFSGGYLTLFTDGEGTTRLFSSEVQYSIDDLYKIMRGQKGGARIWSAGISRNLNVCFFRENFKNGVSVLRFGGTYIFDGNKYNFYDACITMPFNLADLQIGEPEIIEFDDEFGDISTGGGYSGGSGFFDGSSDAFGVPSLPSVSVVNTGFINVYNPSSSELQGFADDLFPDWVSADYDGGDGLAAISKNITALAKNLGSFVDCFINKNLIDYVIDCHVVPVQPPTAENHGLKVGFKTFNYNPAKVTNDYVEVDCGTLYIKEYYKNFLDYNGTRAKLYLPCVGFVALKPEWFLDGAIKVVYHFNVIDGSCVAYVLATSSKSNLSDTVVGTFGGNCCLHIPITGLNYASMISGYIGNGASAMLSLSSGNQLGALSSTMQTLSSKPDVQQSNGFSGGSSFMGVRIPYILIERPVASFSKNYPHEKGLPYNVTCKLSSVKGFTICEKLHTDDINCTKKEKDMIASLFASGVIL